MNTQEIKNIKLSAIRVNANNPRKSLNDQTLEELAQSIKAVGVLQPIIVQNTNDPQSDYTFEIICGERRFRASEMLGLETIPAIVKIEVRADEVLEMALTENLLREDIAPIEEMMVYTELIEERSYTVEKLMERFGKSESYIRSRMRLTSLIEEFRTLLTSDVITIGTAIELSKYSKEIQAEVYDTHFEEGVNYQSWRGNSTKSIVANLEHSYSTDLEDYFFDKLDCYNCQFNTQVISLFTDDTLCGRCTNRQCLKAKNTAYIVERAIDTHERNPELPLARNDYRYDEGAVEELTAKGYDIQKIDWCRSCPIEPNEDDFVDKADYEAEMEEYGRETQALFDQYQSGKIRMYALISSQRVILSYLPLSSSSSSSVAETPLVKLQNQDKRNYEISIEKIVADTKDVVKSLDVSQGEYSANEEQITYFCMAKSLRSENFAKVGIDPEKHYLTDCDRWHLVQSLTEEQKTIIKRDFIVSNFSDAARGNYTAVMLMDYAKQHTPDKFEEIQATHNEVYEKRHTRIEEKIAAIEKE
ncbi:MAG: ParB/RepB/Spo0J family partition protein [Rikenellaceae bacterium]